MRASDRIWIGLLALAFVPAVLAMAEIWASHDYYTHGFLVPLVAAAAFRSNRHRAGVVRRDVRGIYVIAFALLLTMIGMGVTSVTLQGLGLVIAVAGVVVRFWGLSGLQRLAFPVAFLLFMVPLPASWIGPSIVSLQLFVSKASVGILQGMGLDFAREGNVLQLPDGETLFVAEACSGITSLITLMPLGVVVAYFTERTWARRLSIVAAVIPLAMFGNLLRVLGTALAAESYGVEQAISGPLHEMAGLSTFVLACFGLLAVGPLLRFFDRQRERRLA